MLKHSSGSSRASQRLVQGLTQPKQGVRPAGTDRRHPQRRSNLRTARWRQERRDLASALLGLWGAGCGRRQQHPQRCSRPLPACQRARGLGGLSAVGLGLLRA